jgi:hypothetical protein
MGLPLFVFAIRLGEMEFRRVENAFGMTKMEFRRAENEYRKMVTQIKIW